VWFKGLWFGYNCADAPVASRRAAVVDFILLNCILENEKMKRTTISQQYLLPEYKVKRDNPKFRVSGTSISYDIELRRSSFPQREGGQA
jgi:hypothetical protein